jgi:hypothetical protein
MLRTVGTCTAAAAAAACVHICSHVCPQPTSRHVRNDVCMGVMLRGMSFVHAAAYANKRFIACSTPALVVRLVDSAPRQLQPYVFETAADHCNAP